MNGSIIAQDVPCVSCGYNLRGLSPAGRCPECGADVAPSLSANLIRFSDPQWRFAMASAASFSWLVYLYGAVSFAAVTILLAFPQVSGSVRFLGDFVRAGANHVGFLFLNWLAACFITRPEPRAPRDNVSMLRLSIRFIATVHFAVQMSIYFRTFHSIDSLAFWHLTAVLTGTILLTALWSYLAHLCRRLPDIRLARQANALKWLQASLLLFGYGGLWIYYALRWPNLNAGSYPEILLSALFLATYVWALSSFWLPLRRAFWVGATVNAPDVR